jgi:3-phenylpropionate/trans-cinnamate dioxygenase ferredoxin reductase component
MSVNSPHGIVIAGGGLAAQRCAETLRRRGYEGPVRIVCGEPQRPYDRPPLSKEILTGTREAESLSFRPPEWYAERGIELIVDLRAAGVDRGRRRLHLSGGSPLSYGALLIATGGRARELPLLAGRGNVSVLRTVDDALALRDVLRGRPRLAVVGAGFIGQEVAASARRLGAEVTMIEAADAPLAAVLGSEIGAWFTRLHHDEGVAVLTGQTVTGADGNGRVESLALSGGGMVDVDHVVVGVGVAPDVDWLRNSGLRLGRGVLADAHGRTSDPDVFAAGDAAETFDARLGRHVPGSHWEQAVRQGNRAAEAMLGAPGGAVPVTSFWTDQYGVRVQYLGHAPLADAVRIDGDPSARDFQATFTRAGRPVAALLVGRPQSLPAARTLIENGEDRDDLPD